MMLALAPARAGGRVAPVFSATGDVHPAIPTAASRARLITGVLSAAARRFLGIGIPRFARLRSGPVAVARAFSKITV
jgi:hypothetical protein